MRSVRLSNHEAGGVSKALAELTSQVKKTNILLNTYNFETDRRKQEARISVAVCILVSRLC